MGSVIAISVRSLQGSRWRLPARLGWGDRFVLQPSRSVGLVASLSSFFQEYTRDASVFLTVGNMAEERILFRPFRFSPVICPSQESIDADLNCRVQSNSRFQNCRLWKRGLAIWHSSRTRCCFRYVKW